MSQVVENFPANARGKRDDPWIKQMPWSGKRQLAPVFLLGNLHGQGAWGLQSLLDYSPWCRKESDPNE